MKKFPEDIVLQRGKLSERVASHIGRFILQGHFEPGDKLPTQRDLAVRLGVSRTAIREATSILEERGLVETKQGSGTYVRRPGFDSLSKSLDLLLRTGTEYYYELIDLREIIDSEFAARLAANHDEEVMENLDAKLVHLREALDSPKEFVKRDVAFHMAFYEATGNDVLLAIMLPINQLLMETMSMTFAAPGSAEQSLLQHEVLVDCIRDGDSEGARQNVRETAARARERIDEELERRAGEGQVGEVH